MKIVIVAAALAVLTAAHAVHAQEIVIPRNIENLADKAVDAVNVTVDGALLQLAGKFLSSNDPEQRLARSIVGNLKGIYVRSFQFASPGAYSEADVESLRSQLKAPGWSRMASVRSSKEGEDVDVFVKMDKDAIASLAVIAAQPMRLTFVNIVGPIDLEQLARLGGQFGIPNLEVEKDR